MRNIWKIYKRDIKNIFTNPAALVIVIGICILPSLYAWFNIYASWDPYGSTSGIKVAVINNDKGGSLQGKEINIGDDIIEKLKENKDIGWTFVDEAEADYGLTHDKYYASIEIPEDFSERISTLTAENPVKPQLIYRVNEKSNAVAPKITSSGSKALLKSITASFVDEVNKVIFQALNSVGEEIESNKDKILQFRDLIYKLDENMDTINETLDKAEDGLVTLSSFITVVNEKMPVIEDSIDKIEGVSQSVKELAGVAQGQINQAEAVVKIKLAEIQQFNNDFNQILSDYIASRGESSDLAAVVSRLQSKTAAMNARLDSVLNFLNAINRDGVLDNLIGSLNAAKAKVATLDAKLAQLAQNIDKGYDFNSALLNSILETSNSISGIIDDKVNGFDTVVKPQIDKVLTGVVSVSDNADELIVTARQQLPAIRKLIDLSTSGSELGSEYIDKLKEKMPEISESISKLSSKLREVASDENINEIVNILTNNPDVLSEYISNPVDLIEESLYHIPNYGSAMAPFYTILAIWVGVLIVSSVLSTEAHPLGEGITVTSTQEYFGKMLLFVSIAIVQSLIVALGDIFILGVYTVNTPLFIGFSVFSAIIFTIVIYTLVSVFGNVGKGLAVILLVLQVAGSGGTFPIEVTPRFFQILQPYLPFTYGIGSLREAVGGVLWSNIYRDVISLLVFAGVAIVIGLLLKKPLNAKMEEVTEKFKESGLSE